MKRGIVLGVTLGTVLAAGGTAAAPGSLLWEAKPGFRDFGAMIESGGIVVTGNITGAGGIYAFDAATGKQLWRFAGGQMRGAPATDGETVFAVTSVPDDRLVALGLKTGRVLWNVTRDRLGNDFPPLVEAGKVYLASRDGKVNAYDARNGKELWEFSYSPGKGDCSTGLALSGNRLFFGGGEAWRPHTEGRYLWALDPASGKMLWRHRATVSASDDEGQCVTTPAVSGGLVVSTVQHAVFALDASTGAPRWRQPVERMVRDSMRPRVLSQVLIAGGVVYSYYREGLASWSLSSGASLEDLPGVFPDDNHDVRLSEFGGVLYFVATLPTDGHDFGHLPLHALELTTHRMLWVHRVNRPSQYASVNDWPTCNILATSGGVYYENEKLLAKVAR